MSTTKSGMRCGNVDSGTSSGEEGCDGVLIVTGYEGNDEVTFVHAYCEECRKQYTIEL